MEVENHPFALNDDLRTGALEFHFHVSDSQVLHHKDVMLAKQIETIGNHWMSLPNVGYVSCTLVFPLFFGCLPDIFARTPLQVPLELTFSYSWKLPEVPTGKAQIDQILPMRYRKPLPKPGAFAALGI